MAVRKIVKYGDDFLRQNTKEVHKISKKIKTLITDMLDTMYKNNGVGLAAPQIREPYRIFVIDVSDPSGPIDPIIFINPKIIKKSGAVNSYEGCLSFPEAYTNVKRYANVLVKATDKNGRPFTLEAKNGELLSRAIQHEFDHLDGILFIDHARNRFEADSILEEKGLPHIEPEKMLDEQELEEIIQSQSAEQIEANEN